MELIEISCPKDKAEYVQLLDKAIELADKLNSQLDAIEGIAVAETTPLAA